ncbi:MAG TPA: metallophosphoesterase family protein [Gaiellaceae bacterium]|nr:metallophosphoesterase family protein [Gaiellaceae bacterium]
MRIAYVVDVHDRFEAVPRVLAETGAVDLLVVGGDITTLGTPADAGRAIESWRPLVPRLLAVAGNMDSAAIDARLVELGVSLDGRGVVFGDVGIAGVSAAPYSPLDTRYEISDRELATRASAGLEEVKGCRVRVLCPHAPPHGIACDRLRSGEHVGSPALRALVEEEQPDLVLCGHIHEARSQDQIGASRVVNPGPVAAGHFAVVDVGETITVMLD